MAGLVPAIQVLLAEARLDVDACDNRGHDRRQVLRLAAKTIV